MAYSVIKKPSDYFNTKLYTGTGSATSITGVGFQPDFTWIKSRGDTSNHRIYDGVRGATKVIYSNLTNVEGTDPNGLTSFDSDGFSLGIEGQSNGSGVNFASWNWLASNTTASNTDGSISSTVSVNTTSGFSIVSYTGTGSDATVGHGLGSTPKMIIFKRRDSATNWSVQSTIWGDQKELNLNTTGALSLTDSRLSIQSTWTNTLFNVKTYGDQNASGGTFIAYCFAEKQGFSKFGSYVGNGGNQFIYTGFKPAFVIEKRSSNLSEWDMYDNKRNTFNSVTKVLKPNASDAEVTYGGLNFLSNGFEAKGSLNDSGQTLIYMAFAEEPLVGDNPATAR